jgi:hypothetical protein
MSGAMVFPETLFAFDKFSNGLNGVSLQMTAAEGRRNQSAPRPYHIEVKRGRYPPAKRHDLEICHARLAKPSPNERDTGAAAQNR